MIKNNFVFLISWKFDGPINNRLKAKYYLWFWRNCIYETCRFQVCIFSLWTTMVWKMTDILVTLIGFSYTFESYKEKEVKMKKNEFDFFGQPVGGVE